MNSGAQIKPIRAALFGYGLSGRYFHAPFLDSLGVQIVGALTNNLERIQNLKSDFPEARAFRTSEELLNSDIDLVVVASGNSSHVTDAISSLQAGIPVVVDKPMGLNLVQTREIIHNSQLYSTPISTYFNRRFDSDSLTVKRILEEGLLGEIFRCESRFERFREHGNSESWREKNGFTDGGGKLLDLQPHLISTVIDFFGEATLEYSSVRSIRGLADDDSFLALKHRSGVDSYLSACEVSGKPGPRLRLMGNKGALIVPELDKQEALLRAGKRPFDGIWKEDTRSTAYIQRGDEITEIKSQPGDYGSYYKQVLGALREESEWPVSNSDSLLVAEIIDEARARSIR
jgi:predicted dehydrogenase